MNKNQIEEAIEISYEGLWQKTCMTCLRDMDLNNFARIQNVKITLKPDLMEWIDELSERVGEIGIGWTETEDPEYPEEFWWWVEILETISEQIERKRRERSKKYKPKLLLSRKQIWALHTALHQYAHNAETWSQYEELRDLGIRDLKNCAIIMPVITRELHDSVKDECKFCSRKSQ